jgi:iron complex outermembrane recepter protein
MFLPKPCLLLLGLLLSSFLIAQQRVSFKIINKNNEPVSFATIIAKNAADTSKSSTRIADSSGTTQLLLNDGTYKIYVQAVNYQAFTKTITVNNLNTAFTFSLSLSTGSLQGVVVTARKPLMRQDDDKTIVDPEPIVLGSSNAYEVMEKIPGLFMDQDGNIFLNSTTPSQIWINGREQKMSAADVATILKSLPPNSIASIELIRSPSARYDASGGGGIVNVILKKNVKIGMTGSVNIGMNQGRYGNQFAGININNNNGKLTTYMNVNVSNRNSFEEIKTDRLLSANSKLSQLSYTKFPGQGAYLGMGMTYELSKKWELGADFRLNLGRSKSNNTNGSKITDLTGTNLFSENNALVNNNSNNGNIQQGLNLKYKIDSLGSEWVTDISYNYNEYSNEQNLVNQFLFPQTSTGTGFGDFANHANTFIAQTNLVKKFRNKITLETGLKSSNVWFGTNTQYFNTTGGVTVPDIDRSNAYNYDEHIHAAYVQASKPIAGFVLKTGVRVENTNMNGEQTYPTDTSFSIKRTDAFPYVYLSRNLMKIAGYELKAFLIYRRTIARPSYSFLNPSIRIIDPYLFETGNPSLRPQFTNNYEANISVDERPIFAVGINDTKDIFTQVLYQTDSNKTVAVRTYDNIGTNKETYFRVVGAIPGKKVFIVAGAQYNYNFYNGQYEGDPLTFKRGSWSFFTYQNFRVTPTTNISLNGFIRLNGQLQFYELGTFGNLGINISQQLMNKKMTITAGLNDIFYTNWNNFYIQQGSLTAEGYRKADTRRFSLNLRYNFGIKKKEEKGSGVDFPAEQ